MNLLKPKKSKDKKRAHLCVCVCVLSMCGNASMFSKHEHYLPFCVRV